MWLLIAITLHACLLHCAPLMSTQDVIVDVVAGFSSSELCERRRVSMMQYTNTAQVKFLCVTDAQQVTK
jgi:hypothetical protein